MKVQATPCSLSPGQYECSTCLFRCPFAENPFAVARVVFPRERGIWLTNGKVAWWIPDRTVAAWLAEGVILPPEGWHLEESVEGSYDPLFVGAMIHCVQEMEWREVT